MLKIILFSVIISNSLILLQASDDCDIANCNHEGECQLINDKKTCSCIGEKYFQGPTCSEAVDLCERDNPCKNGGKCVPVTGQFICKECDKSFGGLWCDSKILKKAFTNMLLYFNHYGVYAEPHKFLIIAETLGELAFSLELVSDHYAIDSWESKVDSVKDELKWTYSDDLGSVIRMENIRYYNDLPFQKGYYHLASETFWSYGLLNVTLRVYDTATGSLLLFQYTYDLLIMKNTLKCIPQLTFLHGANPLDPLVVDIARYNNFDAIIKERCFEHSKVVYTWSVFNSIGTTKLHDFGETKQPSLKVPPYKLWFDYHGEVMSSYRIMVRMEEKHKKEVALTQSSCFILVLPKPVKAIIKGGSERKIGIKQDILLDGSESRDFALAANVTQTLIYKWDCESEDDPKNQYCTKNMGSDKTLKLKSGQLKLRSHYKFTLTINSRVNKLMSDESYQMVEVVKAPQLFIEIKCIRNCIRRQFNKDNIIHLQVAMVNGNFTNKAQFKWSLNNDLIGEQHRLVYKTQPTDSSLQFEVVVEDLEMIGRALINLTENLPPHSGSCSIDPQMGESFVTEFHIKCQDYHDEDMPLNYQYLAGEFPLQRKNDPEINVRLPETNELLVRICDQFEACVNNSLTVSVAELAKPESFIKFIKTGDTKLSKLLHDGDVLSAMILMKSLVKYINTTEDIETLANATKFYHLSTLLDIEQFFAITKEILSKSLPLDYKKSHELAKFFEKLSKGFEAVAQDHEIENFMKNPYDKLMIDLFEVIGEFSKKWETLLPPQIIKPAVITAQDSLVESYEDLDDFDILNLIRVLDWLAATKPLHKSLKYMGLAGVEMYKPLEDPLIIEQDTGTFHLYALDEIKQLDILFKNDSIFISLNEAMIQDLQKQLHSSSFLLQIATLDNNPFWWYPDDQPLTADVFQLSAYSSNSTASRMRVNLQHPLHFQLKSKNDSSSADLTEIKVFIKNKLHMPIFRVELNPNALLIITFLRLKQPLKLKVDFLRNPYSFELKTDGVQVNPLKLNETYEFVNPSDTKALAYIALLLDTDTDTMANISFALHTEIRECLFWDFTLPDPQWSSRGCRAYSMANESLSSDMKCECYHLSWFTAKTYSKDMNVDLINRDLLKKLRVNRSMVAFYIGLLVTLALILLYNYYIYKKHKEFLSPNLYNENSDIEIRLYTGSHWNAGTSANITMRIISEKGPFSITIYQNPEKPHLKKSSVCKLRISSTEVNNPWKLTLNNDKSGRYPSWYCRHIEIENMQLKQKQIHIFRINQWISEKSHEVTTEQKPLTFKEHYRENLVKFYIDWYQFNPLWGSWQYEDFNRFERSCIWIAQFVATLCVLACYYGRTTMKTYERERELYYSVRLNIVEVLTLTCYCYAAIFAVRLIFALVL